MASASDDLQPEGDIGGGFHLVKRLGTGAGGEVWKAEAPGGLPVAVKIVFQLVGHDETQQTLRAFDLYKELRHPFLHQVLAYWVMDERLIVIMELADCTLEELGRQTRAETGTGIPVPQLHGYLRDVAEALDYLHRQRVLHCDVKAENLLVFGTHAKLGDLALARKAEGDGQRDTLMRGSGTPGYMAPEVWRGKPTWQSDQYALAVTYAELRLDRHLFAGPDLAQVMFGHLEKPPNLDPLPKVEQTVLHKALAKDPAQRYPNCTAFVAALSEPEA